MKNNRESYERYTDNFMSHIQNMSKTDGRVSSYATEAEIFATCAVYDLDIFV